MREIKFRVWDVLKKDWNNNYYACGPVFDKVLIIQNDNLYKVQQFIGLKDKNNKEIYEGDILIAKNYNYPYHEISGIVKFGFDSSFYIYDICPSNISLAFSHNGTLINTEIIGNIFENPGLISKCNQ